MRRSRVVVLQWPVDQIQIDVIDAQLVDAAVESLQRRLVALICIPQLRGEEDVLSRDGRVGDTSSDALFVSVGGSGVDVPVAGLVECEPYCMLGFVVGGLPDSEAELRDRGFRNSA